MVYNIANTSHRSDLHWKIEAEVMAEAKIATIIYMEKMESSEADITDFIY